jgi:hypothetical protein
MSSLIFNIRIGKFHVQLTSGDWKPKLSSNSYWANWKWLDSPVMLYQVGSWHNQ